jgi:hypothetical protein
MILALIAVTQSWKFLGYTKGFGHEHISDEEYDKMRRFLAKRGLFWVHGKWPSEYIDRSPHLSHMVNDLRSATGRSA